MGVRVSEIEHSPLAEHEVKVQLLAQGFPQLQGMLVEVGIGLKQIIGAHDGGVAPGIAAADPALFEHRNVRDAVQFGEIVSRRQTVAAAADDDDIIVGFRLWTSPGRGPAAMALPRRF